MHIDRYERNFIIVSIVIILIFAVAILVSSFVLDIQVPQAPVPLGRVNPNTVATPGASPWGDPVAERLRQIAPNEYEVYILGQTWTYLPNRITVPKGSTVTFYVTSKDVIHGFGLQGTNINMMIIPGQISTLTATFDTPGEYQFVCNEYCGIGHQTMHGTLVVEP